MKFLIRLIFTAFVIPLLLAGCSFHSNKSAGAALTNTSVRPEGALLTPAQVIRIAKETAVQNGAKLSDYHEPQVSYGVFGENGRHGWFVVFKGPGLMPGDYFTVAVDDQTKKVEFQGGR